MNKAKTFKDWTEKHLQGQHSQGAHGRRGGGSGQSESATLTKAGFQPIGKSTQDYRSTFHPSWKLGNVGRKYVEFSIKKGDGTSVRPDKSKTYYRVTTPTGYMRQYTNFKTAFSDASRYLKERPSE